ncbi:MAG: F0F1 ATP synthase subunit B [Proteobacteria bacterium]|nr:MAG: F0F1 ATP synthase subunit B [Pseudomonadota bacterium]
MNVTATLFGQLVVFTVLIWFIKQYLWEPIINTLEDRKARVAEGLAAAEEGHKFEEQAQKQAEEELVTAKAQAAELIAQAQKRAAEIVDKAKADATDEANRIKAAADAEIDLERSRATEELRSQVAALAVSGAEKILNKEIDSGTHAKALEELAAKI